MTLSQRLHELSFPETPEQVQLIAEVALNVLAGNVPLTTAERTYLKSKKRVLRALVWEGNSSGLTQQLVDRLKEAALRYLDG